MGAIQQLVFPVPIAPKIPMPVNILSLNRQPLRVAAANDFRRMMNLSDNEK